MKQIRMHLKISGLNQANIKKYQYEIILFFILILAINVWCYEITLPYFKAWESGYQDLIARNYLSYGFLDTHFLNVISVVDGNFVYRFGHPPLLQILLAISFNLFGIHEWSARIVPIIFSIFSILILYKLVEETFDKEIAIYSAIFSAFVPMSAFFGRNVCFEALVLFFGLVLVYNYKALLERNEKKFFILMILTTIFGTLADWPFVILLLLLVFHSIATGKFKVETFFIFLLGILIIGIYLLINAYITGHVELFTQVVAGSKPTIYLFSSEFYTTMFNRLLRWFNPIVVVLFVVGWFYKAKIATGSLKLSNNPFLKIKQILNEETIYVPFLLTLWGFLFIFAFPNHSFGSIGHTYWMYYLIPGFSIVAAEGLKNIKSCNILGNQKGKFIFIVLLIFMISSLSFTYSYHQNQPQKNFYEIGLLIHNHTGQNDLIAVEFTTIAYYADRHFIGVPNLNRPIASINLYRPKIVEIKKLENNELYIEALKKLNYELIYDRYGRQVWKLKNNNATFSFASNFDDALIKLGESNELLKPSKSTLIYTRTSSYDINNKLISIYQHPFGAKKTFLIYNNVSIPQNAILTFGISMDRGVWFPEKGDGVLFEIYINDTKSESDHATIFSKYIDPKNNVLDRIWHDFDISLDDYEGENVTISFVTSSGPNNDTSYDWAYWGEPRVVTSI